MPFAIHHPDEVRDLAPEVLGEDGRMRVLPAAYWATTTLDERALFGHRNGLYLFPTTELVEYLRSLIHGRKAIEIGAGNGVLAEELGIKATDSKQQVKPKYAAWYKSLNQPPVPYGPNIIEMDGESAVRRFKPEVVIGCWVTHKYDPRRHGAGGNEAGIREEYVIERCQSYVHIGNQDVHRGKAIWKREHTIIRPDWLYSRAHNGTPDEIAIWHP